MSFRQGARQFFSIKKGAVPMKQITLTQNCTNCADLASHIVSLCASEGISTGMCSIVASETRNNLVGVIPVIDGTCVGNLLRYRGGAWSLAPILSAYDADARIGDVYNVYIPDGLWN